MFSFFKNIKIQLRFRIFLAVEIFAFILLAVLFVRIFYKREKQNDYIGNIDQTIIQLGELKYYEQSFLLFYPSDPVFFATGTGTHLNRFNTKAEEILQQLDVIKNESITQDLNLDNNYSVIIESLRQYHLNFKELSTKIFNRGSKKIGIVGEMKKSSEKAILSAPGTELKKYAEALARETDLYIEDFDEKRFNDFIKTFSDLNKYMSSGMNPAFAYRENMQLKDSTQTDTATIVNSTGTLNTDYISELNNLKRLFISLEEINNSIGKTPEKGLNSNLSKLNDEIIPQLQSIRKTVLDQSSTTGFGTMTGFLTIILIVGAGILLMVLQLSRSITVQLDRLRNYIAPLGKGVLPEKSPKIFGTNEIAEMTQSINELVAGLRNTTNFAMTIGKGVFDTEFKPISDEDVLGNSLMEMRRNLSLARIEEDKRKFEDSLRKWSNEGLAKFNEILRQSTENIENLATIVIKELIYFLNANQGGLFILNDTNKSDVHLELVASYAYGHEKKKQKKIYPGEGLVGTVALEKETIYMTDLPPGYITITSGLGGANPSSLVIVPMRVENEIFGVVEIASFNKFEKHEIEFIEKVSESIAASLSITRINARTAHLLEQSQRQAEEKAAQEEEMRQNLADLRKAQEESARREAEMASILNAVDNSSLVIEIDTRGFITSVNQAVLNLFSLSLHEIVDKHHRDFVKPQDEKDYNLFWKELKSGENVKKTEHLKIKDQDFWINVVYAPILDDTGRVLKILTIGTDLTESKLLETELLEQAKYMSEQEEEMRQNLDELQHAQHEMSEKQLQLQEAHDRSAENERKLKKIVEELKFKEEELTKKNEQLKVREEELQQNIQKIETAQSQYIDEHNKLIELNKKLSESETEMKEALRRAQEQELLIIDRNRQLLAGEEELRQNIEELQSTREQLQEQHEQLIKINEELAEKEAEIRDRFTALDTNSSVAEYLSDGTLVYANQTFLETFRYELIEIKGKHHRMFTDEHERRSESYTEFWTQLRNGIEQVAQYKRIKKDGKPTYFKGVYKPLKHSEGEVYKVLEILSDISSLKQIEAELNSVMSTINAINASFTISLDGTILSANSVFASLLEIPENEIENSPMERYCTEEFAQSSAYEKLRIDLRRGISKQGLFTFISQSGKSIRLQGVFSPVFDTEHTVLKAFFIGFDITENLT